MAERRFTDFVPKWARGSTEELGDMPVTGMQPPLAPTLPIRLLPHSKAYSITALTLGQVATATQRIMNYASYEAVHGVSPEFADLRSAESEVLALAQLEVEPFEEGSFIIPTRLSETPVHFANRAYSGVDVLSRFAESMNAIALGTARSVSIGLIQAVEDLGRITRREAVIEYSVFGLYEPVKFVVNDSYIARATEAKTKRRSTRTAPDELTGVVTAVDIEKFTFSLKVNAKSIVTGNYINFLSDKMIASIGERVRVSGNVVYENEIPVHIHATEVD